MLKNLKNPKLKRAILRYLKIFNQLQIRVFASYLQRDYFLNSTQYEIKLHHQRKKLLRQMQVVRQSNELDWNNKLVRLYEIIFSVNSLKLRVKDHTVFEVCEKELRAMSLGLTTALITLDVVALSDAVLAFEEVFQNALQIVATDPLIFLLFTQNMIALRNELGEL